MKTIAYKMGQSFGRHPRIWIVGAACILLALFAIARINSANEERRMVEQKAEEQRKSEREETARKTAHDALVAKCAAGSDELVNAAKAAMKNGYPAQALVLMKPCDGVMTDASKLVYVQAQEAEKARFAKLEESVLQREKATKKSEGVRIGISEQDALDSSWGRPEKVNRTTTASGVREQWVYGSGSYLYFTNGVLTSIQN